MGPSGPLGPDFPGEFDFFPVIGPILAPRPVRINRPHHEPFRANRIFRSEADKAPLIGPIPADVGGLTVSGPRVLKVFPAQAQE